MSRVSKATSAHKRFASINGKEALKSPDDTIKEEEAEQAAVADEELE